MPLSSLSGCHLTCPYSWLDVWPPSNQMLLTLLAWLDCVRDHCPMRVQQLPCVWFQPHDVLLLCVVSVSGCTITVCGFSLMMYYYWAVDQGYKRMEEILQDQLRLVRGIYCLYHHHHNYHR